MAYIIFVAVGFAGALISTVFGFGTALMVLAVGAHILPLPEAVALATVLFTASTISKTVIFARVMDWRVVGIMAASSLPFAYLGAELLVDLPAELLRRLLGVMVLAYLLLGYLKRMPTIPVGTAGLVIGSALYGFVSGLLGTGNVIKVIMFREMKIGREAFVGAMAATSVLANIAKLISYSESGLLRADLFYPILALAMTGIVAALFGRRFLKRINNKVFETGVQILLAIAAISLLI